MAAAEKTNFTEEMGGETSGSIIFEWLGCWMVGYMKYVGNG